MVQWRWELNDEEWYSSCWDLRVNGANATPNSSTPNANPPSQPDESGEPEESFGPDDPGAEPSFGPNREVNIGPFPRPTVPYIADPTQPGEPEESEGSDGPGDDPHYKPLDPEVTVIPNHDTTTPSTTIPIPEPSAYPTGQSSANPTDQLTAYPTSYPEVNPDRHPGADPSDNVIWDLSKEVVD
ncbi:hypothetical protein BGW39_003267 [Mortierella sp. 14UC]|nr:hypothetical protein BGW39_003267 [Mortierella sp. 14UC]